MDRLRSCRLSNSNFMLPPGFRFYPSDEELIVHYLRNKATSRPIPASIITEIDLYKHNPWDLPAKASFGETEWYFFSPRDRKYPNGARPNRAAVSGYWKATGTDKPILTSCGSQSVGVKKALVFYKGRPPKGVKTDWIMHEYRLLDTMARPARSTGSMRLDDWVLCRVRQKSNLVRTMGEERDDSSAEAFGTIPQADEQSMLNRLNNFDEMANYLQKDCPMLAILLASQDSSFDANSNLSFQSSTSSVFQPFFCQGNRNLMVSSTAGNIPCPLKRTISGEHWEYDEDLIPSSKKLNSSMDSIFSDFYGQFQANDSSFSQNLYNPIIGLHPLNQQQILEKNL